MDNRAEKSGEDLRPGDVIFVESWQVALSELLQELTRLVLAARQALEKDLAEKGQR